MMMHSKPNAPVPAEAYMLADHLDAALAAGEDILSAGAKLASTDAALRTPSALRSTIELIRALELALITRTLKAREWSQRLSKADPRFKLPAMSFMGGSAALVDALAQFADATHSDFESADGVTAYFRSRGVIDAEAPALSQGEDVLVTESVRIAGRIELGPLLDMIAGYLDALEVHFLLFGEGSVRAVPASRSMPADASTNA